jgi:hemolysin D
MEKIKALFQLKRKDCEFLPAVLSIQEHPPSPIGRMIIWVLAGFLVFMLTWACIGKLDIVAVAQGKVVPSGKVKIIQPAITGVVEDILVKDGELVKKGQLLILLDKTIIESKLKQVTFQIHEDNAKYTWTKHLLDNIENKDIITSVSYSETIPYLIVTRHSSLHKQELLDFKSKLKSQKNEMAKLANQKVEAQRIAEKLTATLPIIKKRVASVEKLLASNMISEREFLDLEQARIEAEFDLKYQKDAIRSLQLQLNVSESVIEELFSNKRLELQNRLSDLSANLDGLIEEQIQHKESSLFHEIRSPIDGYIEDLVIHTKGGSLSATEPALRVVPIDSDLIVEAMILNKDIGYLLVGQEVIIKMDTFNFVKHGSLTGEILDISSDATEDEKLGLVFKSRIKLNENKLFVDNKYIKINSGMSVVAEAKTGSRRIIDFFLTPVRKKIDQSVRER